MKLTPKQEGFCQEYLKSGNASEAYRLNYNCSNMKPESVHRKAVELFENVNVTARINDLKAQTRENHKIDRAFIIEKHQKMLNAWERLNELGAKDKLTKQEEKQFYLLKELVKGSDYRGSLDALSKMLGLNEPDKVEVSQGISLNFKKKDAE